MVFFPSVLGGNFIYRSDWDFVNLKSGSVCGLEKFWEVVRHIREPASHSGEAALYSGL